MLLPAKIAKFFRKSDRRDRVDGVQAVGIRRRRPRFRHQTIVSREGLYYVAIIALVFGGAVIKEVNLLLILAGLLLGPLLLNWQAVRANLRRLSVRRVLPLNVSAGDTLSVDLHLTNQRQFGSWSIVVEEPIVRESSNGRCGNNHVRAPAILASILFPRIRAGGSRKGVYRGRLTERGRYRFGPARLSTRFPFGLFSRTVSAGDSETLIVLPRLGRLSRAWAVRRQEAFEETARKRRRPGPEGDFYGVREWRIGDGRRLIDWRGSARLDRLVVRQFERPQSHDVAVILDLWQPERPSPRQRDDVELAVSFAATVLAEASRRGGGNFYLGLQNAEAECLGGPASPALLQALMEQLAVAEPQSHDSLPALLEEVLRKTPLGSEVVVVSTRPVDLTDAGRFEALAADPVLRDRARRVLCVDASSEKLSEFFTVE